MICQRCKKDKPIEDYYNWDRYRCRDCRKEIDKIRYPKRKKYLRDYWIKWYSQPENKTKLLNLSRRFAKAWKAKHKKESNASAALYQAIKTDRVIKPNKCSCCFKEGKVEGHHFDYDKYLEVIWLCRSCHKRLHQLKTPTEDWL